jgi:hypothetical protein
MQTVHTLYRFTVDISEELVKKYGEEIHPFPSLSRKLEEFAKLDSIYLRAFLNDKGYNANLLTIRMLEAHGYSDQENGFQFADLENDKLIWQPVDEWIDEHEGDYDALYISCCNEGEIELSPRKSMLIYPLSKHSGSNLIRGLEKKEISDHLKIIEAIS